METKEYGNAAPNKSTNHQDNQNKKKPPVFLIILTIALAIGAGVLGYLYWELDKESSEVHETLEVQKDSLAAELNLMVAEYDELKTDNDSMNIKLEAEQEKIKRLLGISASNAEKIRLYQKELNTLREVMRSYIVQIDSLNQKNIQLTAENLEVRSRLEEVETDRENLSQEKEELTGKVQMASVLSAKNILVSPLNKRSKERDDVDKIVKIRVCFTLRENPIVEAGTKDIYIRILRPDELVLTSSATSMFEYKEEQLVYSAKRQVEYENKDVDMCIYWDNNGDLIPGQYTVDLFAGGDLIGTTTFVLED